MPMYGVTGPTPGHFPTSGQEPSRPRTAREASYAELVREAKELQKKNRKLSDREALLEVLETKKGAEIYKWYSHPDASLPVDQFVEKLAEDERSKEITETIIKSAELLGDGDFLRGFDEVQSRFPNLIDHWLRRAR